MIDRAAQWHGAVAAPQEAGVSWLSSGRQRVGRAPPPGGKGRWSAEPNTLLTNHRTSHDHRSRQALPLKGQVESIHRHAENDGGAGLSGGAGPSRRDGNIAYEPREILDRGPNERPKAGAVHQVFKGIAGEKALGEDCEIAPNRDPPTGRTTALILF
jgi:hypothetical protein